MSTQANEITRLRGQRKVLVDLLEQSVSVLRDLRLTTDDSESRGHLSDLIGWSERAIKDVHSEQEGGNG